MNAWIKQVIVVIAAIVVYELLIKKLILKADIISVQEGYEGGV